jgi:heme-degrading monooxygenase HmoA
MAETYTTGMWSAKAGEEREFVQAWQEFASWASGMPGVGTLRLTRDVTEPSRFLSFAPWESLEAIHSWKASPEFKERIGRVKAHVDDFTAWELELETAVGGGAYAPGEPEPLSTT